MVIPFLSRRIRTWAVLIRLATTEAGISILCCNSSAILQTFRWLSTSSCVSLLEHLADYEEVSGLLSKRSVQTLTKISQGFDTDLLNSDKITLKKEIKDNDELWPWRRILYKCIE
ncbi:Hypothetical_protein [Hexamita inflata]|uniref:Hypothetical_protein n=1 Tax=Hexamita inflata TaxID=28002 RepID=A0AA86QYD8_9EUKA|nr:Hypothetical protein HINF_LOCUS50557 [Hexamita inflata]